MKNFPPKSGGAAAPPCPPGSGPHEYEYILRTDSALYCTTYEYMCSYSKCLLVFVRILLGIIYISEYRLVKIYLPLSLVNIETATFAPFASLTTI